MYRYGKWTYDPRGLTLRLDGLTFEVDLEDMTDSAQMLDWIFQVFAATGDEKDICDFLWALEEILDPQSNYCSNGFGKAADPRKLAIGR